MPDHFLQTLSDSRHVALAAFHQNCEKEVFSPTSNEIGGPQTVFQGLTRDAQRRICRGLAVALAQLHKIIYGQAHHAERHGMLRVESKLSLQMRLDHAVIQHPGQRVEAPVGREF